MFSVEIDKILSKKDFIKEDLKISENYLKEFISEIPGGDLVLPFVINNGKRIRSILYFYFLKMFGAQKIDEQVKYKTAALIEAIHFASIIHDDVVDENLSRRNSESFLKKYGRKKSILVGDYILIKVLDAFLQLHNERFIKNLFIRECKATSYGALLEQQMNPKATIPDYIRIVSFKTSPFFRLASFLGGFLGSNDFEVAKKLATFGTCFGILFQAQNDLNCYRFDNFQKSEDYIQKNITLPIVILRDYFNYDTKNFEITSQKNYEEMQILILSEKFRVAATEVLSKYKNEVLKLIC